MKILYYKKGEIFFPGVVTAKGVLPVDKFLKKKIPDLPLTNEDITILKRIMENSTSQYEYLNENELEIGPCIPRPSKIICIGLNYRKHAIESSMAIPTIPIIFTKYSNTLVNYFSHITLGSEGVQFDYEVELGVVIGTKCKNVSKADSLSYILGYCVANDLSCRDLQFKTSQWLLGKSLDNFLPLGKYLVSSDEIGDPQNLNLTCSLNGELRQNSNTTDMIFPVTEIIEFLSKYMTLEPGDLILTGTPEGVIMGLPEKEWLKHGDVVRVEIDKLGYSENRMV